MTKKAIRIGFLAILMLSAVSFMTNGATQNYKCMIQLTNYEGYGAYVIVSLLDGDGNYVETLYVQGDDEEWYHDIPEWWRFFSKNKTNIDAITGATVSGGQRTIQVIKIPIDKIGAGYQLRFESAVEEGNYYPDDVQFDLTAENLKSKVEGKGYIRYIRMLPTS